MNSTNGTWVGGSRVTGERRLDGAPDVRFGGVKLRFVPAGVNLDELTARSARAAEERKRPAAAPASQVVTDAKPEAGTSRLLWVLLALVIGAAVFFVFRGRA